MAYTGSATCISVMLTLFLFSFSSNLMKNFVWVQALQGKRSSEPLSPVGKENGECLAANETMTSNEDDDISSLKTALRFLDVDFFNDSKLREMVKGAEELNVPAFRDIRKLVASTNGGLHDPYPLVFHPSWVGAKGVPSNCELYKFPRISGVQRPQRNEDIAFMTVLELGALIRTKQITSRELTDIFLQRMKRYDNILEAVVTFTEELAYSQAERADDLLKEGTYLGLVPFAIGSETAGSICFPAARCGVTAIRPTFGTVARTGVMSISESLDKLGPFCRSASDCAIILDIIRGRDQDDPSSRDVFFEDPFSINISKLRVGYLPDAEVEVVHVLASKGVNMVPFNLTYTVKTAQSILNFTMDVDMLSHFDEWQRAGGDDEYEAQDQWPVELRRARLIPAVDYVQAHRARGKLIKEVRESFTVDAFVGNATDWERVCMGNLVGLPVIVIPTGTKNITDPPKGGTHRRTTVTTGIFAPPHRDSVALALAMAYQSVTDHHKQRPPIDEEETSYSDESFIGE
ncbi:uncharacterized protein LOC18434566 isoform X3 [Amborella trichopoda]|uniref:uncharacterized protein LOC18434566 isoform X3 n=1 Tax=Amborella trichopoda TaxID=13333 RepID=UPI0009BF6664|nr:uncharacterized protein LOC18434566 isoform X3 [Amborella trichopoda]|eukprot:XP_020522979.1 uncharacterized protein LOC18434566 isoform X3 [Amborella trichopoda]